MNEPVVLETFPLGFPWKTFDPFLFCVHHLDTYPEGTEQLGPDPALLRGRAIGQDFTLKDGWRMYHGDVVPGFPRHPHRGFETVTVARQGFIDHADSMGATARFGEGDVQWMTAGGGVEHSEMFPLLDSEGPNTGELFQIWLNLPRASKYGPAHFTMMWSETIPRVRLEDEAGKEAEVVVHAGTFGGRSAPSPPPDSFASQEGADVAIWSVRAEAGARLTLPAAAAETNRTVYVFRGETAAVGGVEIPNGRGARVRADVELEIVAGDVETELLILQGRPLGEPVAHYGPFVMNTRQELQQAFMDYRSKGFGGWKWGSSAPVHPRDAGRFAIHGDGRRETPGQAEKGL